MKKIITFFLSFFCIAIILCGCGKNEIDTVLGNGKKAVGSLELEYATQFSADYYDGGYTLLTLGDNSRFLVIPEGKECPNGISKDITPIYKPLNNVYLVSTSAMSLIDAVGGLDAIKLSGTREENWYNENAVRAMQNGDILYAGKYNEPDYELILDNSCRLAIESTMIGHASDVKEKLESLGIPVFVDRSSLEKHPLGRTEWIKLYGILFGKEEKAKELFDEQTACLDELSETSEEEVTAAFFHISSSGFVVVRKSGDYISKMIELAGGKYVFDNIGDPEKDTSTVTIEAETFFAGAKDADVLIYNSAIDGEIHSIDELIAKNSLLKEFKAVKSGNVWCTNKNMYQDSMKLGQMVQDFNTVFSGNATNSEKLNFLYKLQ